MYTPFPLMEAVVSHGGTLQLSKLLNRVGAAASIDAHENLVAKGNSKDQSLLDEVDKYCNYVESVIHYTTYVAGVVYVC